MRETTNNRRRSRRRTAKSESVDLLPAPESKVALPKPQAAATDEDKPQVQEAPQSVKPEVAVEIKQESVASAPSDEDFNFATDELPHASSTVEAIQETAVEAPVEESPRPRRRRRSAEDTSARRQRGIPPEVEAEEMSRAPAISRDELMGDPVRSEPLDESLLSSKPITDHVNVESQIANLHRESVSRRPRAEDSVDEKLNPQDVAATNQGQAPSEDEVKVTSSVEIESASQTERETDDVQQPSVNTLDSQEATVSVGLETSDAPTAESALTRLTTGLTEALKEKGLEVVHTRAELVKPVEYRPIVYPGRPRKVLPVIDEGPLIQVHTKKD